MAFTPALRQHASKLAVFISAVCCCLAALPTQSQAQSQIQTQPQTRPTTAARKSNARKPRPGKVAAPATPVEPIRTPDPPPPNWPVNAQAMQASVGWNGQSLSIAATNSSLHQILRDISTATGVKVEGLGADQRIFGNYGPAPAREVLGKLMEGSGYNILMIGDQGTGTPRQLLLTSKSGGAANLPPGQIQHQATNAQDEDAPDEPDPPADAPSPIMNRPLAVPPPHDPSAGRTPQQFLQELQQRQQMMQNQQNQQQQQQQQQEPQEQQ